MSDHKLDIKIATYARSTDQRFITFSDYILLTVNFIKRSKTWAISPLHISGELQEFIKVNVFTSLTE
jgi:hypothetical protein